MASDHEQYFKSYNNLKIHELMLNDTQRTCTYRDAILGNTEFFKDKIVLDVGAGSGILSLFCAMAGAKHVYAVEAASELIPVIKSLVNENKFSDVITVIDSLIEDIPDVSDVNSEESEKNKIPELVDIIVSEWMGFFLIHECMLESVLNSRRFLKPNGVMYPEEALLYAAYCELPQYGTHWDELHGVKMSSFGKALRSSITEPVISEVKSENLLTEPVLCLHLQLKTLNSEEISLITKETLCTFLKDGRCDGLCFYFEVKFPPNGKYILSTAPSEPITHWKQTTIVFPCSIDAEANDPIVFELTFRKNSPTTYEIIYEEKSSEAVVHPVPCKCNRSSCVLSKIIFDKHTSN